MTEDDDDACWTMCFDDPRACDGPFHWCLLSTACSTGHLTIRVDLLLLWIERFLSTSAEKICV